ncbi:hypothetical protein RUND412_002522 [Rhizina undulata]
MLNPSPGFSPHETDQAVTMVSEYTLTDESLPLSTETRPSPTVKELFTYNIPDTTAAPIDARPPNGTAAGHNGPPIPSRTIIGIAAGLTTALLIALVVIISVWLRRRSTNNHRRERVNSVTASQQITPFPEPKLVPVIQEKGRPETDSTADSVSSRITQTPLRVIWKDELSLASFAPLPPLPVLPPHPATLPDIPREEAPLPPPPRPLRPQPLPSPPHRREARSVSSPELPPRASPNVSPRVPQAPGFPSHSNFISHQRQTTARGDAYTPSNYNSFISNASENYNFYTPLTTGARRSVSDSFSPDRQSSIRGAGHIQVFHLALSHPSAPVPIAKSGRYSGCLKVKVSGLGIDGDEDEDSAVTGSSSAGSSVLNYGTTPKRTESNRSFENIEDDDKSSPLSGRGSSEDCLPPSGGLSTPSQRGPLRTWTLEGESSDNLSPEEQNDSKRNSKKIAIDARKMLSPQLFSRGFKPSSPNPEVITELDEQEVFAARESDKAGNSANEKAQKHFSCSIPTHRRVLHRFDESFPPAPLPTEPPTLPPQHRPQTPQRNNSAARTSAFITGHSPPDSPTLPPEPLTPGAKTPEPEFKEGAEMPNLVASVDVSEPLKEKPGESSQKAILRNIRKAQDSTYSPTLSMLNYYSNTTPRTTGINFAPYPHSMTTRASRHSRPVSDPKKLTRRVFNEGRGSGQLRPLSLADKWGIGAAGGSQSNRPKYRMTVSPSPLDDVKSSSRAQKEVGVVKEVTGLSRDNSID